MSAKLPPWGSSQAVEQSTPRSVTAAAVAAELRQVLRCGVRPAHLQTSPGLLGLRCVRDRAVDTDTQSLAFALEAILLEALSALGDGPYGAAARALFGVTPGSRGRLLKDRRRAAADHLDVLPSTFRRNYEMDILLDIATEILRREVITRPLP